MSHFPWKLDFCGILVAAVMILQGCSSITMQNRFAPRLEDYNYSGYKAMSQTDSSLRGTLVLAGIRPELVLTSTDYEIILCASQKSERILTIGPGMFPAILPIIPVLFLKQDFTGNITFTGSIKSLSGQSFSLSDISATIGADKFDHLGWYDRGFKPRWIRYGYLKNSDETEHSDETLPTKQQKVLFSFNVAVSVQSVKNIDINLRIIEDDGKEILIPTIHFYSSSNWLFYDVI